MDDEHVNQLFSLLGDRTLFLGSREVDGHVIGGDLDAAVRGLDQLWPLRADGSWRLCQCMRYDMCGWYWVLERDGRVIAIDTLDDPLGIGSYGFPTSLLEGSITEPALLAGYLAAKRIRKAGRWADVYESERPLAEEWRRVWELARQDEQGFRNVIAQVFGVRFGNRIAGSVLACRLPTPDLIRAGRAALLLHRFRNPARVVLGLRLGASRWLRRFSEPTGLVVAIVGPDGAGKSILASGLPDACRGLFRKDAHFHWRPGLLPRPGALAHTTDADTTVPHGRPPHRRAMSLGLVGYHWLDFFLGGWTKYQGLKVRSSLVVVERGWADIAVDPRRYRVHVPRSLLQGMGKVLPRPDLVLVLEGRPEVIAARKRELAPAEVARQSREWRSFLAQERNAVFLDADRTPEAVVQEARDSIVRLLERRAASRLGPGWAHLPPGRARWLIPRRPIALVEAGLRLHQPMTPKGRVAWETARLVANLGGFNALSRGDAPPRSIRVLLAPYLPQGGTFALGKANHAGRFFVRILARDGRCLAVAKVATDERGRAALAQEAENIRTFSPLLAPPLRAPGVLASSEGVLLLEPVHWRPRRRPWKLPRTLANGLGRFFRAGPSADGVSGPGHGDFAPWNLLLTREGWVLIDWEEASPSTPPFYDLFHHLVQSYALLGRPSASELLHAVSGEGPLGASLAAYADGARLPLDDAREALRNYLATTRGTIDRTLPDGRKGWAARERLLARLVA